MENRVQLASSAVFGCGDIGPKRASPHGVALRGANHLHIRSHTQIGYAGRFVVPQRLEKYRILAVFYHCSKLRMLVEQQYI